jgi:hypothetical protein
MHLTAESIPFAWARIDELKYHVVVAAQIRREREKLKFKIRKI